MQYIANPRTEFKRCRSVVAFPSYQLCCDVSLSGCQLNALMKTMCWMIKEKSPVCIFFIHVLGFCCLARKSNILYLILNFPDVEMADGSHIMASLKPAGKIGKKLKKKFKLAKSKNKRRGNGKPSKRHI